MFTSGQNKIQEHPEYFGTVKHGEETSYLSRLSPATSGLNRKKQTKILKRARYTVQVAKAYMARRGELNVVL
jgi:hypothetical protein